MSSSKDKIKELELALARRTALLKQVITVANMTNRVYLGQSIEWEKLDLSEVKEFEDQLDIVSWPAQEFKVDCREKWHGEDGGCKDGCKGCK